MSVTWRVLMPSKLQTRFSPCSPHTDKQFFQLTGGRCHGKTRRFIWFVHSFIVSSLQKLKPATACTNLYLSMTTGETVNVSQVCLFRPSIFICMLRNQTLLVSIFGRA